MGWGLSSTSDVHLKRKVLLDCPNSKNSLQFFFRGFKILKPLITEFVAVEKMSGSPAPASPL